MKYRAQYSVMGVDYSGSGTILFSADNDVQAQTKARERVAQKQESRNQGMKSGFDKETFELSSLVRIIQEEISEPVPI